jgi:sn-glycerol 3-phosphate transport system substrate-binding protein
LKDYTAKNPQALVARDQLQYAARELSTHSGPQIQKVFGDELQAALTGKKQPQAAMDDAQKNADNILKQFR